MKKILTFWLFVGLFTNIWADEGMWMLPLIKKLNIQKMNGMGCTLTADDIYSESNSSLKDAVIVFGGGCTGITVSNQGLIFTNHHCGYASIQRVSSVDHNYLKNGFVAENLADELPCTGLTVKYLVKIQDVTDSILLNIPDTLNGIVRTEKINVVTKRIKENAEKGTNYIAQVRSFNAGNEYYLFVYEEFKDVRLAFTPPSSIGKFGGETDNWMWPRHTGDFSVFRVYSAKNGKPAEYSKDNIPYTPKRFAVISNQGYNEGDFSMIMGNPGSTSRYLTSWGVNYRMKVGNMSKIDVRGVKQAIWQKYMHSNDAINLAYANKYAGSSNYWKNSIGMNKAINKLEVIAKKQKQQQVFTEWVNENQARKSKFKDVLTTIEDGYNKIFSYGKAANYLTESFNGVEMPNIAMACKGFIKKETLKEEIIKNVSSYYKDYYQEVDQATMVGMLDIYKKSVAADALPEFYKQIEKKYDNDYAKFVEILYKKSDFSSLDKLIKAINKGKTDFSKDPAILFAMDVQNTFASTQSNEYTTTLQKIKDAERLYVKGVEEMAKEKNIPVAPDANFTMRLTYGKVLGYSPSDAVDYKYYTTTKGILEKEQPNDFEFEVDSKLKESLQTTDFGAYADKRDGQMHVAFLSNNDITGGNSGSPIFNAKGELIGLAFDGNWEAMSGDIVFEPNLQRTISVDIRYVLFVMDKVGKAKRLIDELTIK